MNTMIFQATRDPWNAAPDLLAAAQLMLAWFKADQFHSEDGFYQRMQMCRDAEDAMLRAVAKATGDTP